MRALSPLVCFPYFFGWTQQHSLSAGFTLFLLNFSYQLCLASMTDKLAKGSLIFVGVVTIAPSWYFIVKISFTRTQKRDKAIQWPLNHLPPFTSQVILRQLVTMFILFTVYPSRPLSWGPFYPNSQTVLLSFKVLNIFHCLRIVL